jgi:membrane protease YdiL (CAAX protease family)
LNTNAHDPFDPRKFRPFRPDRPAEDLEPQGQAPGEPAAPRGDAPPAGEKVELETSPARNGDGPAAWSDDIPITGTEAILAILAVWAIMFLVSNYQTVLGRWIRPEDIPGWMSYVLTLAEHVLIIALLYYLLNVKHEAGLVDGLQLRLGSRRWMLGGAAFGVALFGGVLLAMTLSGANAYSHVPTGGDRLLTMILVTVTALSAAFAIELYFRGLIFPLLRRGVGLAPAVIIVSLWFGLSYFGRSEGNVIIVAAMCLLGLAATLARHLSRSLGPSIAMHATYTVCLCAYLWWQWAVG